MSPLKQALVLVARLSRRPFSQRATVLLCVSILVCTCVTASLGFFAKSVQSALDNDIANFLGAPLVVRSDQPLPVSMPELAGLAKPVMTQAFTTGAISGDVYQSVSLKAVSAGYPLQGDLVILSENGEFSANGEDLTPTTAWLDQRAMHELNVVIGDQVQIGATQLTVTGEIRREPDRLTQLQHALPRVMVSQAALAASGVNNNNNRGEYRALYTGEEEVLRALENIVTDSSEQDFELLKPGAGNHPFSRISQRAERLSMVILVLILLLCGSATATLANHLSKKYAMPATVLRCMGVNRRVVTIALCLQLLMFAFMTSLLGCLLAWLLQPLLITVMQPHMTLAVADVQVSDLLAPVGIGLVTVVAFVIPRLAQLSSVSVVSALRGCIEKQKHAYLPALIVITLVIGMLWFSSDNLELTLMLTGTVMFLIVLSVGFGWGLSKLSGLTHRLFRGPLKVAVRSISRSPKRHIVPLATVSIAMMAVLMTVTLRGTLLDVLHVQTLEVDGNYIYTGLPQNRRDEFVATLNQNQAVLKGMYPTVSAKLIAINGVPVDQALKQESDTREETRSKVRLSWAQALPGNNIMLEGTWPESGSHDVSVESEVMSDLGLALGDTLSFAIGDATLNTTISSRREYRGGGSKMMFWFMFAPDALESFEQRMMGGILLAENLQFALSSIQSQFPQVRITDLERQIAGIRSIMFVLTRLLNVTLLLLLGGALMVIIATSFVSAVNRSTRLTLMRALGLRRGQCYAMNIVEHVVIALVASLVGVFGVQLMAGTMFQNLFALQYELNWAYVLSLTAIICATFAALGWAFAFRNLQQPVSQAFQS